jgi:3-hydroxyacyl-[acyl-carrier-protein] dehydratase
MEQITSLIPHRPPFLFVDEAAIAHSTIKAKRHFAADEWFFQGHFPGYPVVPGVLLIEAMAQAGGVGAKLLGNNPRGLFVLAKIRSATFRRQVRPGETLDMEVVNLRSSAQVIHQRGVGKVGDEIAVEAEWIAMSSGVEA